MEWNVILFDPNERSFKSYNVFNNSTFYNDVCKMLEKKGLTWKDISHMVDSFAAYSFRSRCEYELILDSWPHWGVDQKIDVYYQLKLNWNAFIDCIVRFYR